MVPGIERGLTMSQTNENPQSPPQAPPQPSPQPQTSPAPAQLSDQDARLWAMLCHLAALAAYIISPIGGIIGALIVWLIKKDQSAFVDEQGKESVNFQITVAIGFLICIPLMFILIGIPLAIALGIFNLVMIVVGAIKANSGEHWRYPISIRFIK